MASSDDAFADWWVCNELVKGVCPRETAYKEARNAAMTAFNAGVYAGIQIEKNDTAREDVPLPSVRKVYVLKGDLVCLPAEKAFIEIRDQNILLVNTSVRNPHPSTYKD